MPAMRPATPLLALLLVSAPAFAPACGGAAIERAGGRITIDGDEAADPGYTLSRETLNRVVGAGPSWFIRQVSVRPVLLDGEFYGFEVLSLFPDRATFPVTGLEEGDIVQRVNGLPIGRPEEFMAAWDAVAAADHLSVRVLRGGRPLLVTWTITDPRAAAGP